MNGPLQATELEVVKQTIDSTEAFFDVSKKWECKIYSFKKWKEKYHLLSSEFTTYILQSIKKSLF